MGRARGRSSGRISISRGRSIELPSDVQPILKETGADVGQLEDLRAQLQQSRQQLADAQSTIQQLQGRNQDLQQELRNTVPLAEARSAVQQAFQAGVQRVIDFLRQRGIL
jgi:chromosome segregation ATPase